MPLSSGNKPQNVESRFAKTQIPDFLIRKSKGLFTSIENGSESEKDQTKTEKGPKNKPQTLKKICDLLIVSDLS